MRHGDLPLSPPAAFHGDDHELALVTADLSALAILDRLCSCEALCTCEASR